ncbi:MAG: toll/interleukin-1 receptor domain-containing protein [Hyphomicrobiales bacterium]|nr:toll/interleukin-1 receptor domain-containing protein [Hyphomicrobiales bacterium]MCC2108711.1 toll/interleukin-1 receptor domain-containing protein [Hyphomicrobiales bacterium]
MSYRVFISHGSADKWVALQIERAIRADCGAATFVDVYDVAKGDDIEARIFEELPKCRELVVLLTPWSVDRNWVWVEIGAARALGLRIVAVLYQVPLDVIEREKGGSTFLRTKNIVEINELPTYLEELNQRVIEARGS